MISRLRLMARGGKFGLKREARNNIPLSRKGSDESDEDYTVGEDEDFNDSEDEDCSLVEDETDDSLVEFVAEEDEEEEEEEEEEQVRMKKKVRKPGVGKYFQVRKKNVFAKGRKKKVAYSEEEDDDDDDDDFVVCKPKRKHKLSCQEEEDDDVEDLYHQEPNDFDVKIPRKSIEKKNGGHKKNPRKRTKFSYRVDEEEGDCDDSYEDDDEEFTPDEVDGFDEEELPVTIKNKVGRIRVQETQITRGKRKKRNTEVKKTEREEPMIEKSSRKRSRSDHGEFVVKNPVLLKKKKPPKPVRGRRRKPSLDFDSDFVSSGSIDCEYTVSEEEREQVREASEFCGSVATSLRSSNALKMIKEEEFLPLQRKYLGRKKGKEKVVDMNVALGKQVCGICLSEEGKRTVRGILNCCSHYFCFTCIMEWSKVESRCPLCKQRFATVCRTVRDDGGHDLRDSVIHVPERDQVYQPSEEELRGYLDPYENVLCTECLQGGDDALMLLCDICDSPAHSYCVGLGREVPEGNWYCYGCRPTALTSLNAPHLNATPDLGATNNSPVISSPVATVRETFDLNELYVPETPQSQVAIPSPSPRHSLGDILATSPGSGSGAFTLSDRRRIQRQIHHILSDRTNGNRQIDGNDAVSPVTAISLFGSRITRDGVLAPQHIVTQSRMAPQNTHRPGRLPDNSMPLLYRREVMSPRLSSLRGHVLHNQASTSTNHTFDGLAHSEFVGANERISRDMSHQQLYPCSGTSNAGSEAGISPFRFREAPVPSRTLQGPLRTPF